MDYRVVVRYFLNVRVIGVAVLTALLCSGVALTGLFLTRAPAQLHSPATAILEVIPVPSATQIPPPTSTPTPTVTPITGDIPLPPADIALGALVQVSGTGGDGLRLRSEPGLQGTIRFLGLEAEVFKVEEGPESLDGYSWWLLVALYDPEIRGWAVSNYLTVVQNP